MSFKPFKISKVETHSQAELLAGLRRVVMLKNPAAKPYAQAALTVTSLPWSDIRPAQRYVLVDGLAKIHCLEWELAKHGLDLFALDGYLTIWTDHSEFPIDLLPPIVETIQESEGSLVNIINDGMHRMYVARLEWKRPQVVLAQGLPPEYPYYAYPIPGPNPWDSLVMVEGETIPANLIKKWHRQEDNKLLYRDFNSAFQNVGGPRGQG
ncbi:MAG: hypothetical protein LBR11_04600 [Deltaproteobacteria bacterium]|jgi:hypothetical protein|nr:hypothetical protein [Deltaproteobacteria bacterium]